MRAVVLLVRTCAVLFHTVCCVHVASWWVCLFVVSVACSFSCTYDFPLYVHLAAFNEHCAFQIGVACAWSSYRLGMRRSEPAQDDRNDWPQLFEVWKASSRA